MDVTAGATFFVAGALPPRAARFDALPMAADAEALKQAMRREMAQHRDVALLAILAGVVSGFVRGLPPFVWRHKQEARAFAMDPAEGFEDGEWDEEEEAQFRAAIELNRQLKMKAAQQEEVDRQAAEALPYDDDDDYEPATQRASVQKPFNPRASKQLMQQRLQQQRIDRENAVLVRHMNDINRGSKKSGFSHNARFETHDHVAASAITRKRQSNKIIRENRAMAQRLEAVGDSGGIRSSGYGRSRRQEPRGPLAKRNLEIARRGRAPRLQQPEMNF